MRTSILRPSQQRSGGPPASLEKVIGTDKKSVGSTTGNSDFAGISGTTGTFTIATIKPGDIVFPGAVVDVVTVFAHAAALTVQLGITGTLDRFVADTSVKSTTVKTLLGTTATHALAYVNNTASDVLLVATFTAASGDISGITAGELRIRVPLCRKADRLDVQA